MNWPSRTPSSGYRLVLLILAITLSACAGLEGATADFRARLDDIDLKEAIADLTDCQQISETFVEVISEAADNVDAYAEASDGRLPETSIKDIVDDLAVSQYYSLAEKLGCARLDMQTRMLDQLIDLQADTPSGEDFLDEVMREVQTP